MATRVGANRIVRGGRFHHPFGDPADPTATQYAWRRAFAERLLHALRAPVREPTVFDVEPPI